MAKYSEETRKILHMTMIFGTANKRIWDFLSDTEVDNAYEKLLNLSPEELARLSPTVIRNLKSIRDLHIDNLLERCDKAGIEIITYRDEVYPESLSEIENPPAILYCQGNKELLLSPNLLTIVGTRNPTDYTLRTEKQLCGELIEAGIVPVTGFAVGVDIMANRVALLMKRPSIAVMGCGLDINYPKQNKIFKNDIIKTGLILSEYPPATSPRSHNFPQRNRILAGISQGTFVVQAPKRSGTLITAEFAAMWGHDVYCLPPADIFDKRYGGVKKFLRDGAFNVFEAQDILFEYDITCQTILQEENVQVQSEQPEQSNIVDTTLHKTNEDAPTPTAETKELSRKNTQAPTSEDNNIPQDRRENETREESDSDSRLSEHGEGVNSLEIDVADHTPTASAKELFRKNNPPKIGTSPDGTPMTTGEKTVFDIIAESEKVHIDTIIQKSGFDARTVSGILTDLEMCGKIERLAGCRFRVMVAD